MSNLTREQLICGPEKQRSERGMTDLERICAIGWDVGEDGCWYWRGELNNGRAKVNLRIGNRNVARVLWQMMHGSIEPESLEVCHNCFNAACVNPDHVRLGTHAENMAEARPGRGGGRKPILSRDDVVRARYLLDTGMITRREMARVFMVAESTLASALNG